MNHVLREITYNPSKRVETFRKLKSAEQIQVILNVTRHVQKDLFAKLMEEEQINLIEHLDPTDSTDLLQLLDTKHRERLLEKVDKDIQGEIITLLEFEPDTAAGLMNLDYVQVEKDMSIAEASEKVRVQERRTGRVPIILVMEDNKLAGYLPIHKLGFSTPNEKVAKYCKPIQTIRHGADTKEVMDQFQNDPHGKIVVLNEDKVLGIIYSEDVLRLLYQQHHHSLYEFAGLSEEESVYDSASRKFLFRYKWLIINLGTAFLAAFTVSFFEDTISKFVLLAVYMPIVAGMGGNAGTQTLAVMVRGLALHDPTIKSVLSTLKSEVAAAALNGFINGLIVFFIVYFFNKDPLIGIVLATAMIINLVIAAIFGTLVPYVMEKLGKDPASSATIFITTATDVFGFLVFLGLAKVVLG